MPDNFIIRNGIIYEGESLIPEKVSTVFLYYADGTEEAIETVRSPHYLHHEGLVFVRISPTQRTYSEVLAVALDTIAVEAIRERNKQAIALKMTESIKAESPEDIEAFERELNLLQNKQKTNSGEILSSGSYRDRLGDIRLTPEALENMRSYWADELANGNIPIKPISPNLKVEFNPTPEDMEKIRNILKTED